MERIRKSNEHEEDDVKEERKSSTRNISRRYYSHDHDDKDVKDD